MDLSTGGVGPDRLDERRLSRDRFESLNVEGHPEGRIEVGQRRTDYPGCAEQREWVGKAAKTKIAALTPERSCIALEDLYRRVTAPRG